MILIMAYDMREGDDLSSMRTDSFNQTEKFSKALKAIQTLHIALNDIGKNLPYLVGMAGEIHVLRELTTNAELKNTDFHIQARGGQAKHDLDIIQGGQRKHIEVKTSTMKNWFETRGYGWTIQKEGQDWPPRFDILICVGIADMTHCVNVPEFYIFKREEINTTDVRIPGYKSVKKALHISETQTDFRELAQKAGFEVFSQWERDVNLHKEQYRNHWEKLFVPCI